MLKIGSFYLNGFVVTKDYAQAKRWYEKAAAAGNSDAMKEIGDIYYRGGEGVPVDVAEAKRWYEKAVLQAILTR